MIDRIHFFLNSKIFYFIRIIQFLLALSIFAGFALMPSRYAAEIPAPAPILHFIGNVLLFCSAWIAFHGLLKRVILVVMLVPYSAAIELAQWLTPTRTVDPQDLAANMAGLATGFCLAVLIEKIWRRLRDDQG